MTTRDRAEALSPELALVDEQLRPARQTLREPSAPVVHVPTRSREPRTLRPAATGWGGLLAVAATVTAVLVLAGHDGADPESNATSANTKAASTSAGGKTPTASVAGGDVVLRWKPTQGARLYNVILWRNGVRVLDLWPTRPTARVPVKRLEAGRYQWFVYPMLGSAGDGRYGRVIARGTVKV